MDFWEKIDVARVNRCRGSVLISRVQMGRPVTRVFSGNVGGDAPITIEKYSVGE